MQTTQPKLDHDKIESDNEEFQNPSLADYQLTRDGNRKKRFSSTRISNDDFMSLYSTLNSLNSEPTTFEEVVNCIEANLWKRAMKNEMDFLIKNKT